MRLRRDAFLEALRGSLWFIPGVCVVGSVALAFGMVYVDQRFDTGGTRWYMFAGSASGAQSVLSTIASSMLTFTALVFTITMVVLQLAANQYSPRVLRTYLRDRESQLALGVFVGTFVYALLILQAVRGTEAEQAEFVPSVAISVALALVLLSVTVFVRYAHHIAQSIRVMRLIDEVAAETFRAMERLLPAGVGTNDEPVPEPEADVTAIVLARRSGVITGIDEERLRNIATEDGFTIELLHPVGAFVPNRSPLLSIRGTGEVDVDERKLLDAIRLGRERTMQQDLDFGFRQLVDMAIRALSPSLNDPTTAVQCLDRLHDLLRRMAGRATHVRCISDDAGRPRVVIPRPLWEDYLAMTLEEVRHYGEGSIQIARRLRVMLEDLASVTSGHRRKAVETQRELLEASVRRGFADWKDRHAAETGDVRIPF